MSATATFNPDQIARYEAGGWRAYYDRQWAKLLTMTVTLCQEQFQIPFPRSLKAAYHIVRASVAWVPVDHDLDLVRDQLARFYMLAARYSPLTFNPRRVAEAELRYWDANRRLSGHRDDPELVATMTALQGAIFGLTVEEARESAEWRARSLVTLDRITGGRSTDIEGDWCQVEEELGQCYRAVGKHLRARQAAAPAEEPASSNDYHFITYWRVEATPEEVSEILADAPGLVRWWPSVYLEVNELSPGDEHGIGRVIDLYTKGWLPYALRWSFRVTESRYPLGFTLVASGDFEGRGIWTLEPDGAYTDITYDWNIRADKPLLRYGSLLMKPIFSANHEWAMRMGEESLKLEIARRRARTTAERALVPAPPRPTTSSPLPLLAGAAATTGLLVLGVRRLARR
jgi:hypothetical protein